MKKHIIIGNWKMYVEKPEAAKAYVTSLKRHVKLLVKSDVVIVPPFTLIPALRQAVGANKSIRVGAQSVSAFNEAKHTGEVSARMLKAFGVSHVIVGHSERRAAGESDETIRGQLGRAHEASMTAVLCVGETERDSGGHYVSIIERQLSQALKDKTAGKLIVAYEPVWAIGKSAAEAMKPAELREMAIFIRKTLVDVLGREAGLKVPILYGGSVEGSDAKELLAEGGVGGFLVGHASATADSFIEILQAIS